MPNFRHKIACVFAFTGVALFALTSRAQAQTPASGFAVERFYPSGPGGGWLVMNALDSHGDFGGAMAFTLGYEHQPLRINDGGERLAVVSHQALADLGFALTYSRWRFYINVDVPLSIEGQSGTASGYTFAAPSVSLHSKPDTLMDPRVGVDARLVGGPQDRFRFGLGAQLIFPSGNRADYDSDGTFRAMLRAMFAGDERYFTWAAQLGVHIRPLDDSSTPQSPRGSELIYGVAAGAKLSLSQDGTWVAIIGPEVYGATAFRAFTDSNATAVEAMLSARVEERSDNLERIRIKVGVGGGINPHFGAAEWRVILGVELFAQHAVAQTPPATVHR